MRKSRYFPILLALPPQALTAGHPFTAVSDAVWYADAAAWAGANGIVTGDGGCFSPDGPITRGQMAATLYRLTK